jgi:hypothetical protein
MELNLVGSLRFEFGACQRCQPRPDIPQEMAEDRVQLTVATVFWRGEVALKRGWRRVSEVRAESFSRKFEAGR